jgi:hypothetical protein
LKTGEFTGNPSKKGDDLVDAFTYAAASKTRWIDMGEVQRNLVAPTYGSGGGNSFTGY